MHFLFNGEQQPEGSFYIHVHLQQINALIKWSNVQVQVENIAFDGVIYNIGHNI